MLTITTELDSVSFFISLHVYSTNTLEDETWQQINISIDTSGSSCLSTGPQVYNDMYYDNDIPEYLSMNHGLPQIVVLSINQFYFSIVVPSAKTICYLCFYSK